MTPDIYILRCRVCVHHGHVTPYSCRKDPNIPGLKRGFGFSRSKCPFIRPSQGGGKEGEVGEQADGLDGIPGGRTK